MLGYGLLNAKALGFFFLLFRLECAATSGSHATCMDTLYHDYHQGSSFGLFHLIRH